MSERSKWRQDQLLACIRENPGRNVAAYMKIMNVNPAFVNTMRNDLNTLVRKELIQKVKAKGSKSVYFWPVADQSIKDLEAMWRLPVAEKRNAPE